MFPWRLEKKIQQRDSKYFCEETEGVKIYQMLLYKQNQIKKKYETIHNILHLNLQHQNVYILLFSL